MDDDQFMKLFRYMTERFDKIEAKLGTKADKADTDRLYGMLDGIAGRLDKDDAERAAIIGQLDRHEGWIHQLAAKVGTKLG